VRLHCRVLYSPAPTKRLNNFIRLRRSESGSGTKRQRSFSRSPVQPKAQFDELKTIQLARRRGPPRSFPISTKRLAAAWGQRRLYLRQDKAAMAPQPRSVICNVVRTPRGSIHNRWKGEGERLQPVEEIHRPSTRKTPFQNMTPKSRQIRTSSRLQREDVR
jgi:hypothetical protein